MGQAKINKQNGIVKGAGYKAVQKAKPRPLRIKPAKLSDKWWLKRGWVKNEAGKWQRP